MCKIVLKQWSVLSISAKIVTAEVFLDVGVCVCMLCVCVCVCACVCTHMHACVCNFVYFKILI